MGLKRSLFVGYIAIVHIILIYFIAERILSGITFLPSINSGKIADPTESTPIPTPIPVPSILYSENTAEPNVNASPEPIFKANADLIIPVVGVSREQLIDTFSQSRSDERVHEAIDIPAPLGTPVVAAADGRIVKFHDSDLGGTTIYQLSSDNRFIYYYAHLQSRSNEISEGNDVAKGTTIGYVGDTGNAGLGNYHLHFSISIADDPKRYWEGENINPYPLLREARRPQ